MTVQRSNSPILPTLILALVLATGSVSASELGTIEMKAQLPLPHSGNITDVWGYVDPATGKEYALAGTKTLNGGVFLVDVSDPVNPFLAKHVFSILVGSEVETTAKSTGFEIVTIEIFIKWVRINANIFQHFRRHRGIARR